MNKGFCEECNSLVEYEVKEINDSIEIKGKKYNYKRLIGYCKNCGEEISSSEINDENLNRIDKVYRNEENIITTEEINKILNKYKIGKKPLSKLLGWGEITLIRYLNGDVPSKVYSEQLYNILNNEDYMSKLIEENKGLITERAYNNVKEAIRKLKEKTFECSIEKEIDIIAKYIIAIGKEITPLALQKILYYAQGFYKAFFGKFLLLKFKSGIIYDNISFSEIKPDFCILIITCIVLSFAFSILFFGLYFVGALSSPTNIAHSSNSNSFISLLK